jgi:hypothetical protein
MKTTFLLVSLLICSTSLFAQSVILREISSIPSLLPESSGLEISEGPTFWSHNDGGGEPEIYHFDSSGTYFRPMRYQNAQNVDWEDMTQDAEGYFYMGDFGNNNNRRQDLRIYKAANPLPMSTTITNAEIIEFSYPDQVGFPPSSSMMRFDMEAMIWFKDALYLFSKNRTDPFDGIVHCYRLPDSAGTYTAVLVDSFYTGPGTMLENWVTSADISPDGKRLFLLGQGKAWLFSNFTGDRFFDGTLQQLTFNTITQKEAVCFASNSEVYITDELVLNLIGGKLYYLNLDVLVSTEATPDPLTFRLRAYPNPFTDNCTLSIRIPEGSGSMSMQVYNTVGEKVHQQEIQQRGIFELLLPALNAGSYYAVLSEYEKPVAYLRLFRH